MAYNHHQARASRYGGGGGGSSSGGPPRGALDDWAEWAARSLDVDLRATPLQNYIERCCNPSITQPNLALNLEVADFINQKKANTPREAAVEVVRRVNSRLPHVSLLALHLLDILIKNCGYPFHLQIATKEFLNELVKRFPERPPVFPSPVQTKILELIHEWKLTICVSSKNKEDLVHIRDMHRLLGYKGYRFPNIDSRAASVMNPENNLKSPEELEEEDRAAQAAKLQELIRRGSPRDLEQAQELMKIMSGAEPEAKPDYSSQTRKELDKVQSRAILLNDMLNNAKEGEKFAKGDAYDQISTHLRSVQPRIQKWISEGDEGESDQMDRLLLMNDLINQICERYIAFSKGDFSATANIDASIDPSKGGSAAVPTAKISDLISFDDESASTSNTASGSSAETSNSVMDDFASLTFDDSPAAAKPKSSASSSGPGGLPADLFSTSNMSAPISASNTGSIGPKSWGALQLPTSGASSGPSSSGTSTPILTPSKAGTSSQHQSTATDQTNGKGAQPQHTGSADPFADLDSMFG